MPQICSISVRRMPLKTGHVVGIAMLIALFGWISIASAQTTTDRQDVPFSINYNQTSVGQSVFILGDLPELGGNDVRRAVRMEPTQWPNWRLTISLPKGSTFSYRFIRRDDAPGRLPDATNQLAISGPFSLTTNPVTIPAGSPASKAIVYHSGFQPPVLWWRTPSPQGGAFVRAEMLLAGPGRGSSESRWLVLGVGEGRKPIEFYLSNTDNTLRDPPGSGTYLTSLDAAFLQDGNIYSYVPASAPSSWTRDYNPSSPPGINSTNLSGELRRYRVLLPRGYAQHPTRRYPVIYFHDGQNMFEAGAFGSWNAHTTAGDLTRLGQMREVIMVGVDNGPNRLTDYAAPDSGGQANRYAAFLINELKPLIDAQFRTLPTAEHTLTAGSSMGGQVSLYLGWDFSGTFGRIGAFSGAWNVFSTGFYDRVRSSTTRRSSRIYLDSGTQSVNAVLSADNYWPTANLRDDLITSFAAQSYVLERDVKHAVGLNQDHNEAAWAARLPEALRWLAPAADDQGQLLPLATRAIFDVDLSGSVTIDDLYAQVLSPRDLNLDGLADLADTILLATILRQNELGPARAPAP